MSQGGWHTTTLYEMVQHSHHDIFCYECLMINIKSRHILSTAMLLASFMALSASISAGLAQTALPPAQQAGAITYITGGIGDEERDALEAVKSDYTLSIISAGAAQGAFSGDTHISISRKNEELLSVDAGPIFYAMLPPGRYRVTATSRDQIRSQTITIIAGKQASLHFSWK